MMGSHQLIELLVEHVLLCLSLDDLLVGRGENGAGRAWLVSKLRLVLDDLLRLLLEVLSTAILHLLHKFVHVLVADLAAHAPFVVNEAEDFWGALEGSRTRDRLPLLLADDVRVDVVSKFLDELVLVAEVFRTLAHDGPQLHLRALALLHLLEHRGRLHHFLFVLVGARGTVRAALGDAWW